MWRNSGRATGFVAPPAWNFTPGPLDGPYETGEPRLHEERGRAPKWFPGARHGAPERAAVSTVHNAPLSSRRRLPRWTGRAPHVDQIPERPRRRPPMLMLSPPANSAGSFNTPDVRSARPVIGVNYIQRISIRIGRGRRELGNQGSVDSWPWLCRGGTSCAVAVAAPECFSDPAWEGRLRDSRIAAPPSFGEWQHGEPAGREDACRGIARAPGKIHVIGGYLAWRALLRLKVVPYGFRH